MYRSLEEMLSEWLVLADAATPGPWSQAQPLSPELRRDHVVDFGVSPPDDPFAVVRDNGLVCHSDSRTVSKSNAAYIALSNPAFAKELIAAVRSRLSPVQGEELPELDVTDEDRRNGSARGERLVNDSPTVKMLLEEIACRERQLRAYGAEIRRLKGQRDRMKSLLIDAGLAAGGHILDSVSVEFLEHIPEEISLALSASRADALKEACEAVRIASSVGRIVSTEELCSAILARMEKAS